MPEQLPEGQPVSNLENILLMVIGFCHVIFFLVHKEKQQTELGPFYYIMSNRLVFTGQTHYLHPGKEYVVGRKNCDILLTSDQSISRAHAQLVPNNHVNKIG